MSQATIDLSQLPVPGVIETLDYEHIKTQLCDAFQTLLPEFDAWLPSDPAIKLIELFAYRELLLRQRINEAAKGVMLAYAVKSSLDNLAANYGVTRKLNENDEPLRARTQMALEGITTAGPVGAYEFHALSAHDDVKSVSVDSPSPGVVQVTVLSLQDNGVPSTELLQAVEGKLNQDTVRPLTDNVIINPADIVTYSVEAQLTIDPLPGIDVSLDAANQSLQQYILQQQDLGKLVPRSGLFAALHVEGVKQVTLQSPSNDIMTSNQQAAFCDAINITAI